MAFSARASLVGPEVEAFEAFEEFEEFKAFEAFARVVNRGGASFAALALGDRHESGSRGGESQGADRLLDATQSESQC